MDVGTQADLPAAAQEASAPMASTADEPRSKPGTPAPGCRPQTGARPATGTRSRLATPTAEQQQPQQQPQQQQQQQPQQQQQRPKSALEPRQQPAEQRPVTAPDKLLPGRPKTAAPVAAALSDKTPMVMSFNPDPRLRSWQRLEHKRLHTLGLSSKLSRRYNVSRRLDFQPVGQRLPVTPQAGTWLPSLQQQQLDFYAELARRKNEVAPFRTLQKPICGAFFTRETENRKIKHNLEPTDLIKWRYFL